jgi:NADH-quinone oxidoreductase subunit A
MLYDSKMINDGFSFLFFIVFSLGFCFFMLFLSWISGGKSNSRYKNIPFESGIISVENSCLNFSAKFYLIAMFFVIFDVEALYLYAWSVSVHDTGWIGFIEALIFIMSIILSLVYLVRIKALNWTHSNSQKSNT